MRYDRIYEILAQRAIKQAVIDLETFAEMLIENGVQESRIQGLLLDDLNEDGPIFGKFFRSLGGAATSSVNAAARQGEYVGTAIAFDETYEEFVAVNDLEDAIDDADPEAMQSVEDRLAAMYFTWICMMVNTCDRCLPLHGQTMTKEQWDEAGYNPEIIHEGWTSDCQCRFVEASTVENREDLVAPLLRIRTKTETGLKLSKRTVRAVAQKDLDKAIAAVERARSTLEGRRTMREAGKVNAE